MTSIARYLVFAILICSLAPFAASTENYEIQPVNGWFQCFDRVTNVNTPISSGTYGNNVAEFFSVPQITHQSLTTYRPNLNCTYYFHVTGGLPNEVVHLYYEFTVWDIHHDCFNDYMNLYTISELTTFCGLSPGRKYGYDPSDPHSVYFYGVISQPAWYALFHFLSDGTNEGYGYAGYVWSFAVINGVGKRTPEQMRDLFKTERMGSPSAATGSSQFGQYLLRERMKHLSRQPHTVTVKQQINSVLNMQEQIESIKREKRSTKDKRRSTGHNHTKSEMILIKYVWEDVINPERLNFIRYYQRTHDLEKGCGPMAVRMQKDIVNYCLATSFNNKK